MISVLPDTAEAIHQNETSNAAVRVRILFMWFEFKFDLLFFANLNSQTSVLQIIQAKKSGRFDMSNFLIYNSLIKICKAIFLTMFC